jgi:hypothetical protein
MYIFTCTELKNVALVCILYINQVDTSQGTLYVSATKTSWLMLFKETVAEYCENHV